MNNNKILTFLVFALVTSMVYAGVTNLSSLTLSSDLIVGDDVTITDTLTVSGSASIAGITGFQSDAAPNTNITPTAVGQIVFDSTFTTLCVSTAATAFSWAVSGSTNTACSS